MECNNCGTSNEEGSVYCKHCGQRLDGKIACGVCGAYVDANSVYCNICGARVDGKTQCPVCGKIYEGNFCPACGTAAKANRATRTETRKESVQADRSGREVAGIVLNKVSCGLAILGAVLPFIFVFLIGLCAKADSVVSVDNTDLPFATSMSNSIFYYFGDSFKEISEQLVGFYTRHEAVSLYLPAVVGLVVAILTILATSGFAITAVVKSVRNLTKRSEKCATPWAVAAYCAYLFGAVGLLFINSACLEYDKSSVYCVLSSATVCGIILGGIVLFLAVGCDVASDFIKDGINVKKIVGYSLALCGTVLTAVVIAFIASPLVKTEVSVVSSSGNLTKNTEYAAGFTMLYQIAVSMVSGKTNTYGTKFDELQTQVILGAIFGVIAIALCAAVIATYFRSMKSAKDGAVSSLVVSSCLLACTVAYLVLSSVASDSYGFIIESITASGRKTFISYAPSIVALVMAALNLAVGIIRLVFSRGKAKTNDGDFYEYPAYEE